MKYSSTFILMLSAFFLCSATAAAQENIAQQTYAIFEQNCLNCHGEHGSFTEEIIIDHTLLLETDMVVPGKPLESPLYRQLLGKDDAKRMPLGQPMLQVNSIIAIGNWIQSGAPDWRNTLDPTGAFITPKQILETVEKHVNSLTAFDRPFTRYFTTTHLYSEQSHAN